MRVTAIIAAGGTGRRLGSAVPKQWLEIGGKSVTSHSLAVFDVHPQVAELILVVPPGAGEQVASAPTARPLRVVTGGPRRQDSVANAFDAVAPETDVVLVHDAARPFVSASLISRTIAAAAEHGAAVAAVEAHDTIKRVEHRRGARIVVETLPRETIYLAQTPQAFRRDVLARAVALGRSGVDATDEAMLVERCGLPVHVVAGESGNVKITTADDLAAARRRMEGPDVRIGTGYDLHRLVDGRPLVIGGVTIPSSRGALGHSDADVVCHAITDAILGAAGLGDIGAHFPDSDPRWKGASSVALLRQAVGMAARFEVMNVDVSVVLESPKIRDFIEMMRIGVAGALGVEPSRVSIKGKTNEGLDAVGRGEAIAAHAVVLLRSRP